MGTLNSEFEALKRLESEFSTDLSHCDDLKALETIRIKYLGKKGAINQYFKRLAEMPVESRAEWGRELNRLKNSFQQELSTKSSALKKQQQRREFVDVSLPGYHSYVGKRHPLTQILDDIKFIFTSMGFTIEEKVQRLKLTTTTLRLLTYPLIILLGKCTIPFICPGDFFCVLTLHQYRFG